MSHVSRTMPACVPNSHAPSSQEMDPAMIEAIQAIKFEGKNFR